MASKRDPYTHFVITPSGRIESAWHYKTDADEHLTEMLQSTRSQARRDRIKRLRIAARSTLVKNGIDPRDNKNWTRGEQDLGNASQRCAFDAAKKANRVSPKSSRWQRIFDKQYKKCLDR